jgi:hypothetical protein
MNFNSQFTLPTSYFILPTSPFCFSRDCSGKREMSAQKFAVKAGNFSVLVEIVVRVVLGVAVHKPHPDGQSDYAGHSGHECAFQFVGHIIADVIKKK